MGIKIYTYKDPFHLDKYSYWNEIKQYPHLCVSQTLVQGLDKKYKRSEFSYLYCIDDLIKEIRINDVVGKFEGIIVFDNDLGQRDNCKFQSCPAEINGQNFVFRVPSRSFIWD